MSLDTTSFDAALKSYYTPEQVLSLVYTDNPLLALMPKMTQFLGKNLPIPIIYANPQNRSATFSDAQNGTSTTQVTDFTLTRKKDYAFAYIDNETLEASKDQKGAFMEAATTEIDGALHSLTRSLAVAMYRDDSGWVGQVSVEPTVASTTFDITLKDIEDITNIEVGQTLVAYSAKSGGSARTSDGTDADWVVKAVNRDTGVITVSATYSASGDIAADDYLFVKGDRGNKIMGLEGWLPSTAPASGDSHFGVDRSVDVTRLAGIRYDGSADPIEEALVKAASRGAREGAAPKYAFMSYAKYAELENALGSKVQYVDLKAPAEIGFRGIQINGPRGPISVVADQNCPGDVAYMLDMTVWKLYSLGQAPTIFDTDGRTSLRQASADGIEVRAHYYAQIGCKGPGRNIRVAL